MAAHSKVESILKHPSKIDLLQDVPENVGDFRLKHWDKGIFALELLDLAITPPTVTISHGRVHDKIHLPPGQIKEGTYGGTQLAITEMFTRIENSYASFFDVLGIEPTLPREISLEQRKNTYQWSDGTDGFPPHLKSIPSPDEVSLFEIFNGLGLVQTRVLIQKIIPDSIKGRIAHRLWEASLKVLGIRGEPYLGTTIAEVEERNKLDRKTGTDIMKGDNIGDLPDWYSDARFAQQSFTGANPNTITLASSDWVSKFIDTAKKQRNENVQKLLGSAGPKSLYIQDASYFRDAVGVSAKTIMHTEERWLCASVSLFQLHPDGRLHPIAIVIDYKGSMDDSVTIFNKRLHPSDPVNSEKTDWPWRYAKTCALVSDWIRHEVTVHLVNTHMAEEVIIVATNRNMDNKHPVFRLLEPHWFRTLSLNAAARSTLVPQVIFQLIGLDEKHAMKFLSHAFKNFNFVGHYVPNDLPSRGFPPEELDEEKFKNYAYGKNIKLMWITLRKFVASMLALDFPSDASVVADSQIKHWYKEIQTTGQLPSFPTITTRDELIDAVTMCIHIASPQHTAVNYLQNFYMNFVIAKPAALCEPPPRTLSDLLSYTERELVEALPINRQREWLLSAQVPWLLSFRVAEENNLINYAISLWRLYMNKKGKNEEKVKQIAETFYNGLRDLIGIFADHSKEMTPGTIPYSVLDPTSTAVSILI